MLGPRTEHTIDDGEGGQWIISMRPRLKGPSVVEESMVTFRRSWAPLGGFGVRVWALRKLADEQEWRDVVAESSIHVTTESAQNALAWTETIRAAPDADHGDTACH